MNQAIPNPMTGIRAMVFRAKGTPQRSAKYPRRVTPIPPRTNGKTDHQTRGDPQIVGKHFLGQHNGHRKGGDVNEASKPQDNDTGPPLKLRKANIRGNVIPMVIRRKFL
jgi:hypothetical protein